MIEYNEHTIHAIDSFFESNFDLRLLENDEYMIINFMNSLINKSIQQDNECKYCK
jgi:hypothetical protein